MIPDPGASLPLALEQVEGKVVVIASANPAVKPGDEVMSIDGVTAADALAAALAHVLDRRSGAPTARSARSGAAPRVRPPPCC